MEMSRQVFRTDRRRRVVGVALVTAAAACAGNPDDGTSTCGVSPHPDCVAEGGSDARPDATDPVEASSDSLLDLAMPPDVTHDLATPPDVTHDLAMPPDVTYPPDAREPVDLRLDSLQRCGDTSPPSLCFQLAVGVFCSDIVFVRAYCAFERWTCPVGYSFSTECPCGVPPKCLPEAGRDRTGGSDADGEGDD